MQLPLIIVLLTLFAACAAAPTASESVTTATGTEAAESVTIEHIMGTAEVACSPQRIVTLGQGATDAVLALGITPVGAVDPWGGEWYAYLTDQVEGVTSLGSETEPNLETINALKPDLILGSRLRHEAIYDQLNQIAPTVFAETIGKAWKENFPLYAQALCMEAEGAALLQAWEDRVADFQAKMGADLSTEISLIRYRIEQVRIYTTGFPGSVLRDAGLSRPESQQVADWDNDPQVLVLSKEQIPMMDGDILFYMVSNWGDDEGTQIHDEWTGEPLWQALQVVQNDAVYPVNEEHWNLGGGIQAANLMLDDLYQIFLPNEMAASAGDADFPVTITDALDREITFESPAERVVVIYDSSLGLTAMAGIRPVGHLSSGAEGFFKGGESIPSVMNADYSINYELVASVEPDLILMEPEPSVVAALAEIAPVYTIDYVEGELKTLNENVLTVARIVDSVDVAEANLAQFNARLQAYATMVADVPRRNIVPVTIWDEDAGEWYVYGSDDWFSCAELIPIFATCNVETSYTTSIEGILELDPEWIWLGNYDVMGSPEKAEAWLTKLGDNPLWNELSAVKNDQLLYHPEIAELTINTHAGSLNFFDVAMPILYPDIFNGPLTDEQVQEILGQ